MFIIREGSSGLFAALTAFVFVCCNMDTVTFLFTSRGWRCIEDLLALSFFTLGKILMIHCISISEVEESFSANLKDTLDSLCLH